jgi:hypothetical protein
MSIDLKRVAAVYCPGSIGFVQRDAETQQGLDTCIREFARGEMEEALVGSSLSFINPSTRLWANNPMSSRLASFKTTQLRTAATVGFKIPDTLITNHPMRLKSFYDLRPAGIIGKTVSARPTVGPKPLIPTQLIHRRLLKCERSLRVSPVQFQEFIKKDCMG